jgi:hypothetical protein
MLRGDGCTCPANAVVAATKEEPELHIEQVGNGVYAVGIETPAEILARVRAAHVAKNK